MGKGEQKSNGGLTKEDQYRARLASALDKMPQNKKEDLLHLLEAIDRLWNGEFKDAAA